MTVFDDARTEWQQLLAKRNWVSPVFGDTYYIRYPIDAGTQEALTYKKSIFKGDDSVHAWDGSAVRQKIIQRIIETQERTIRPWYGELSFFSDSIKFLPPLPESELDFVLRTSLMSNKEDVESQPFIEARQELLQYLDPEILPEEEHQKSIFDWDRPEDRAKKYSKVQIELYGLLNIIKDRMFVLTDEEILQVIEEILLDVEQADKFLVKRFVDPKLRDEDIIPFVGQTNPEIRLQPNFMLKFIGGGDEEFYKHRVFQLWLRNILDFDKRVIEFIEDVRVDLFEKFPDDNTKKMALLQAIKLYKWETLKERLTSQLRAEYATKKDYKGYRSDVIHLFNLRNEVFSEFTEEFQLLPIDPSNYDPRYICHELGIVMIDSILRYLGKQIPEPEGVGGKIQARLILNKRITNLEKYVLTEEIRDEILHIVSNMFEKIGLENENEIEDAIRKPYGRLVPRGEYYFTEMETEVKQIMQEMGDRDLRTELAESTDNPQTLVKQYGNQAFGMTGRDAEITEIYSTILGLKSTELMFSGTITLTPLKIRQVTNSLINEVFRPQFDFLKLFSPKDESDRLEE